MPFSAPQFSFSASTSPPVCVGGLGGSGTRVVAGMLRQMGYHLGDNLNSRLDNLWFTFLFKRQDVLDMSREEVAQRLGIFVQAMTRQACWTQSQRALIRSLPDCPAPDLSPAWLDMQAELLLGANSQFEGKVQLWGWKEPNSHVVLHHLVDYLPDLKYVHVIRNGLDMAFSSNQYQLRLWGTRFLGEEGLSVTPRNALKYWRAVHERVLHIGSQLGARFLLLSFDELCDSPDYILGVLLSFLEYDPPSSMRTELLASVDPPPSIGRFKRQEITELDEADVAFVASLGFDTQHD